MTREQILVRLTEIFREVFADESLVIREDMTAEDIEEWDSIEQVYLIVSIEEVFGIRIMKRMEKVKRIDKMIDIIEQQFKDIRQK